MAVYIGSSSVITSIRSVIGDWLSTSDFILIFYRLYTYMWNIFNLKMLNSPVQSCFCFTFFTSYLSSVCRKITRWQICWKEIFGREVGVTRKYGTGGMFPWPGTSGIIPTDDAAWYLIGISVKSPLLFLHFLSLNHEQPFSHVNNLVTYPFCTKLRTHFK